MKQVEKICKAANCGKTYTGAPTSKYCSAECVKRAMKEDKRRYNYRNKDKIYASNKARRSKNEEIISPTAADPKYTLIKKETLRLPDPNITSMFVPAGTSVVVTKFNQPDLIQDAKNLIIRSVTLDQVLRNIAMRHKYKDPKSFVSHIEDMLILYAES